MSVLGQEKIDHNDLGVVRKIVLAHVSTLNVHVFLFGSHAHGKAGKNSDIDVALLPLDSVPDGWFPELREKLEEANILASVDVVDLRDADDQFRDRVLNKGVKWND